MTCPGSGTAPVTVCASCGSPFPAAKCDQHEVPPETSFTASVRRCGELAAKVERLNELLASARSQCEHFLAEKERALDLVASLLADRPNPPLGPPSHEWNVSGYTVRGDGWTASVEQFSVGAPHGWRCAVWVDADGGDEPRWHDFTADGLKTAQRMTLEAARDLGFTVE